MALMDIVENEAIIRYGEVIGYAAESISKGCWIDEKLVMLPVSPDLKELPVANDIPETLPRLKDIHSKDSAMKMAVLEPRIY